MAEPERERVVEILKDRVGRLIERIVKKIRQGRGGEVETERAIEHGLHYAAGDILAALAPDAGAYAEPTQDPPDPRGPYYETAQGAFIHGYNAGWHDNRERRRWRDVEAWYLSGTRWSVIASYKTAAKHDSPDAVARGRVTVERWRLWDAISSTVLIDGAGNGEVLTTADAKRIAKDGLEPLLVELGIDVDDGEGEGGAG